MAYELFQPTWAVRKPTGDYLSDGTPCFLCVCAPEFRRTLQETMATICKHYRVPLPKLKVSSNILSGRYYPWPWRATISLGFRGPDSLDDLLHELAHHLDYTRNGGPEKRNGKRQPHGLRFRRTLWNLTVMYYGDPTVYNWEKEYARVRIWATKKLEPLNTTSREG